MTIQTMFVSSTSAATPSTRRPNITSGFSLFASSATGVSSAMAQAPEPISTTTNRAAERTILASGRRLSWRPSGCPGAGSSRQKKEHPIAQAHLQRDHDGRDGRDQPGRRGTQHPDGVHRDDRQYREERTGEPRRRKIGPGPVGLTATAGNANAATIREGRKRVATARRRALATWGALPIRSSRSGTKRPSASNSTTAIAAAASQRVSMRLHGTQPQFCVPKREDPGKTAIQARRSTSRRSVAATTSSWTPGGQVNAAEAPMAATVNSSSPEPRKTRRRNATRRATRVRRHWEVDLTVPVRRVGVGPVEPLDAAADQQQDQQVGVKPRTPVPPPSPLGIARLGHVEFAQFVRRLCEVGPLPRASRFSLSLVSLRSSPVPPGCAPRLRRHRAAAVAASNRATTNNARSNQVTVPPRRAARRLPIPAAGVQPMRPRMAATGA